MSTKIQLLPEHVANQIAAGEVVDRPASVVKELMENALDAGAGRLVVEVEQGGRRLIRVVDDGCGMGRDDALLALERHATSKVRKSEDLFKIVTLGFRGEALPSIASVSDLTMTTSEDGPAAGVRVVVEAGTIKSVSEAGAPRGTEIAVRRLFHNVPARRKFLKTVATELGHITHLVSNMALARPDVHVTLIHNGATLFDLPSSADLSGRLRHALGADAVSQLAPINRTFPNLTRSGPLLIHGFVSRPSYLRSSTRGLHIFVNRRFVRDRLINHAVFEAYRNLIPRGKYPLVVLFLDLPADAVDVNVHPAKHEIRFQDQAAIHQAVLDTILDALKNADRAPAERALEPSSYPFRGGPPPSPPRPDPAISSGVTNALARYFERTERDPDRAGWTEVRPSGYRTPAETRPGPEHHGPLFDPQPTRSPGTVVFADARVIGQAAGTFILAETGDALLIIDQHAAHERVAYERIRAQWRAESVVSQPLLFPETVELTHQEAGRVEAHQETLLRLGLEVEPFGGGTVAIKAAPAILAGADPAKLLLEVVDRLGEVKGATGLDERLEDIFAVIACHSVVRAHETMSRQEIQALFMAMDQTDFAGHCPHGREVVVRVPFREMEKWFGR